MDARRSSTDVGKHALGVREQLGGTVSSSRGRDYVSACGTTPAARPRTRASYVAVRVAQRVARPVGVRTSSGGSSGSARMCASAAAPDDESVGERRVVASVDGRACRRSSARRAARRASAHASRRRTARPRAPPRRRRDEPTTTGTARRRPPTTRPAPTPREVVGPGPHALAQLDASAAGASRRAARRARRPSRGPARDDAEPPLAVPRARARDRGSSPARAGGSAPAPRARRRRRPLRSSPRSTMRLSATRVVPSATPNSPHHCTSRRAAHPGRVRPQQQARDQRPGRQRPLEQLGSSAVGITFSHHLSRKCNMTVVAATMIPEPDAARRGPTRPTASPRTAGPTPAVARASCAGSRTLRNAFAVVALYAQTIADRRARGPARQLVRLDRRVRPHGPRPRAVRGAHARSRAPAAVPQPQDQRLRRPLAARLPVVHADRRRTGAATWPTTATSSGRTSPTSRCTAATRSPRRRCAASSCATRPARPAGSCSRACCGAVAIGERRRSASRPAPSSATQLVLIAIGVALHHPWVYFILWLAPYLTVWRVINRLRSIAEHGGMQRSKDRRLTTHSVRQSPLSRFFARAVPHRLAPRPPRRRRRPDGEPPGAARRAAPRRLRRRRARVPQLHRALAQARERCKPASRAVGDHLRRRSPTSLIMRAQTARRLRNDPDRRRHRPRAARPRRARDHRPAAALRVRRRPRPRRPPPARPHLPPGLVDLQARPAHPRRATTRSSRTASGSPTTSRTSRSWSWRASPGRRPLFPAIGAAAFYGAAFPAVQNLLLARGRPRPRRVGHDVAAVVGVGGTPDPRAARGGSRRSRSWRWVAPRGRPGPDGHADALVGNVVHLDRWGHQPFRARRDSGAAGHGIMGVTTSRQVTTCPEKDEHAAFVKRGSSSRGTTTGCSGKVPAP